ncbi:MAG: DUF5691 domain-containing protein [Deinococcota bacterium]
MSDAWDKLSVAALLGTERQPYTSQLLLSGIGGEASSEAQLLADAATLSLQRNAGRLPEAAEGSLQTIILCPEDSLPMATDSLHLRQLVQGQPGDGPLKEWLELCQQASKRVHITCLPDTLNYGRNNVDARPYISAVLGERGHWLASFNQDWYWVRDTVLADALRDALDTSSWDESIKEQLRNLVTTRASAPERALSFIETIWSDAKADARLALMNVLEDNLSQIDEPFLEAALDDSSKRVRARAAELLMRLSQSRLNKRMTARLPDILSLEQRRGNWVMQLTPIPELTNDLKRDGLNDETRSQGGKKASYTQQVLERVPLEHITAHFEQDPNTLIDAAVRNKDWTALMLTAWFKRAVLEDNKAWAQIFMANWDKLGKFLPNYALASLFGMVVPPDEQDAVLLKRVNKASSPLYKQTELVTLLGVHKGSWSPELTRKVLEHFNDDLASIKKHSPYFQQLYGEYAQHMRPQTLQKYLQTVTLPLDAANWLDNLLATMRDVADIRYAIHEEFGLL